jgi:hypothetical protein
VVEFLLALVPSVGVLLLFWYVVRALIEGDRRERLAQARLDRETRESGGGRDTAGRGGEVVQSGSAAVAPGADLSGPGPEPDTRPVA